MGVRFTSSFYSTLQNVYWTCELIDINYPSTGVSQSIELFGEGFEINYQQQSDERFTPIKGSDCKLSCVITDDATGTNLLSWINSTINATKEDQYFINIKKNGDPFWYGVILSDLNTQEDASKPFQYTITATDGLKRLETKPLQIVEDEILTYTGRVRFTTFLFEILKLTPLYLSDVTILFGTAVNWYEDGMGAIEDYKDPLEYSRIAANTFVNKEENETLVSKNAYEILEAICEQWGLRIMLSEGYFRIYQVNIYDDEPTEKYERLYDRTSGGFSGAIEFNGYSVDVINNAFPHVETGGQFQWFAPVKNAYLKMPFVQQNMLDETDSMPLVLSNYVYFQDLRTNILGGASKRLNLSGALNLHIKSSVLADVDYTVIVEVKLKLGSKYLKFNSLTKTNEWTDTSTDRAIYTYNSIRKGWSILNYSVQTPEIPSGTYNSNEFEIKVISVNALFYAASSGAWASSNLIANTNYEVFRVVGKSSLKYNASSKNENEEYFEYIGGSTTDSANSYDIEFNDALFGDGPDSSYPGALFVSSDNVLFIQSASKWKINAVGTGFDFNILRVREVMSGQFKPCLKYQNSILGQLLPHNAIEYAGFRMIFNGGTFSAMSDKLNGEWFAVSIDRALWVEIQGAVAQAGNGGTTQIQRQFGGLSDTVFSIVNWLENTAGGTKIYSDTTGITVAYVSGNYFCDVPNQTYTMPPAADMIVNGYSSEIYFKNICSDPSDKIYVDAGSGETIDGEATLTLDQYESALIISNGNNLFLKSTHKTA